MFGIDDIAMLMLMAAPGIIGSTFQKKPKVETQQYSRQNPQQRKMMKQIMQNISPQLLQQLYGDIDEGKLRERFDRTTGDPAREQFSQEIIPQLQEIFTGLGSKGGDAEEYQLASAGRGLERDLARQYEGVYGQEEQNRRSSINSLLGAQTFDTQPIMNYQQSPVADAGGAMSDVFSKWLMYNKLGGMNQPQQTPSAVNEATVGAVPDPYRRRGLGVWGK